VSLHVKIEHDRVAEFCRQNPIERLAFFGSVLRDDFGPQSDVDVLVEFTPQAKVTLLDMVRMQDELSDIIGRRVDLRTKGFLSRYFRDEVEAEAEVEFVA
jgi:predicted nucleotidyltransferase